MLSGEEIMNNETSWNPKTIKRLAGRIRNGRAILGNYPGMTREQQDLLFHLVMECEDCDHEAERMPSGCRRS